MTKFIAIVLFALLLLLHFFSPAPSLAVASLKLALALGLAFVLFRPVYDALCDGFDAPRTSASRTFG